MLLELIKYPNKILNEKSSLVDRVDSYIRDLSKHMICIMYDSGLDVLSAPEVGKSIRLFVMNPWQKEDLPEELKFSSAVVCINPVITKFSGTQKLKETCFSIPDFIIHVERYKNITLKFSDLEGKVNTLELEGYPAAVAQHGLDHLEGNLILDNLTKLKRSFLDRKFKK